MGWEVDFSARPFRLSVRKTSQPRSTQRYYVPFGAPDTLYRQAARSALRRLAEENRELRQRPARRASVLTSALAEAIMRWTRVKWPKRGD